MLSVSGAKYFHWSRLLFRSLPAGKPIRPSDECQSWNVCKQRAVHLTCFTKTLERLGVENQTKAPLTPFFIGGFPAIGADSPKSVHNVAEIDSWIYVSRCELPAYTRCVSVSPSSQWCSELWVCVLSCEWGDKRSSTFSACLWATAAEQYAADDVLLFPAVPRPLSVNVCAIDRQDLGRLETFILVSRRARRTKMKFPSENPRKPGKMNPPPGNDN